jgi:hypothetical protein
VDRVASNTYIPASYPPSLVLSNPHSQRTFTMSKANDTTHAIPTSVDQEAIQKSTGIDFAHTEFDAMIKEVCQGLPLC